MTRSMPDDDPERRCRRLQRDAAQTLPLVAALVVCAGLLLLALIPLGRGAAERAQARAAADAAALAGAGEGPAAAREVAAANGGRVLRYQVEGTDVWVSVQVGGAVAEARARRGPVDGGASP